jgi:hypothetical protein
MVLSLFVNSFLREETSFLSLALSDSSESIFSYKSSIQSNISVVLDDIIEDISREIKIKALLILFKIFLI